MNEREAAIYNVTEDSRRGAVGIPGPTKQDEIWFNALAKVESDRERARLARAKFEREMFSSLVKKNRSGLCWALLAVSVAFNIFCLRWLI